MENLQHRFIHDKKYFQSISKVQRPAWIEKMLSTQQIKKEISVVTEEFPLQFKHIIDQTSYHISIWQPKSYAKGIIIVLAGMGYHVGNSWIFAKYMAEKCDMIVAGYDYKNFGKSGGDLRGKFENFNNLLDTTEKIIDYIWKLYGSKLKVYLSGLSLGGAICFKLALKNPKRYSGIIFFSPALRQNKEAYVIIKKIARFIGSFFPTLSTVRASSENGVKYTGVSSHIDNNDPHMYTGRQIIGNAKFILDAMEQIQKEYHLLDTPYLLIQSGVDKSVDPFAAIDLQQLSKTKDKHTIYCKDMWHMVWYEEQMRELNPIIGHWLKLRPQ